MGNASARLDPERLLAESGWVRALAQSLVGASDVDDVVQETWRVALERPPRLDDSSSNLRGWLATVMRNLVQRSRRAKRMRADHFERVSRELASSQSDAHERVLLQRHLADAVLNLEEPYKSAIVSRYFDGLAPREIAELQGISYDAARQRLSRGLGVLRARLDRDYGGERATWSALCVALLRRKAALASPGVVVGGIVVSVKSVLAVAAALVLAVASWWWLRTASAGPSDARELGAQPVREVAAATRDGNHESNSDRQVASTGDHAIDGSAELHDVVLDPSVTAVASATDASFEARLDAITATFLTEQPDFRGLAALWDEVAAGASLVLDRVTSDGTNVSGDLSIPGASMRAKFEILKDSYRVSFDRARAQGSESPYASTTVTLAFRNKSGVVEPGASSVQFNPDFRRSAALELRQGEERLIGWTIFQRFGNVQAMPVTVRQGEDGAGFSIGQSPSRPNISAYYGVDGRAEQALFDLLSKQASKR